MDSTVFEYGIDQYTRLKAIIADVDGTLYYQEPVRIMMGIELLLKRPWLVMKILRFRMDVERGKVYLPQTDVAQWMYKEPLKWIRKFRDVDLIGLLNKLHDRGVSVILYSDHPCAEKGKYLDIKFDAAYTSSDNRIMSMKPDPKGLYLILEENNLRPQECLYIGDRMEKDGYCADKCGVKYIILSHFIPKRKNQLYNLEVKVCNKKS